MWPKMLLELLPHLGRLVPMAERFLATRGVREQEEQAALSAIAETVRTELGKVTETDAAIQRTLAVQGQQVSDVAAELLRVRTCVEAIETRLGELQSGLGAAERAAEMSQKAAAWFGWMLGVVILLLVGVVAALGMLLSSRGH